MRSTLVEVVLLSARHGALRYRVRRQGLDARTPDAVAGELAGGPDAELLHSTSWRFEDGRVVLTYVALPDPRPAGAVPLAPVDPPAGTDPLRPCPSTVDRASVAAHACRHLAFLWRTDPLVRAVADRLPELWPLVDRFEPDVAGVLTLTR